MTFEKISIHPINLETAKNNLKKFTPTEKEYKSVLDWIRQVTIEKGLTERRQLRLINDMVLFFKIYKKPTDKISREELESFKEKLLNDKITKQDGKPYKETIKEGLTESLVRYFEYNYPKKINSFISKTNKPLRKWFIIRSKKKTPEILTEQEIKKLYKEAKPLWQKYAIAVLFDSGARIEEFLNFRFEDLEAPTKNFPYYQIDIRGEYSKTQGRKVGLYWEYCTEAIAKYLASIEKQDAKDRVLNIGYDAVRMFLTRLGKRVLDKRVHAHMFRKSSATFYASKLNRQQLCKRFGWVFSSDVVDVYINRAGIDEFEVKEVMLDDDISKVRKESRELKTQFELREKEYSEMFDNFRKEIEGLKRGKKVLIKQSL
ncbi:MAG: hypothetical protein A3F40_04085 [Chlamydiae bacterium RIFCSPHIGHO2_12_FULL_27_8]|nr:MAG: hypothetical protein A3F40_04085 [Chlamydiae bacterium RIFCSPHIGHO2_12_FULL_27_8]